MIYRMPFSLISELNPSASDNTWCKLDNVDNLEGTLLWDDVPIMANRTIYEEDIDFAVIGLQSPAFNKQYVSISSPRIRTGLGD